MLRNGLEGEKRHSLVLNQWATLAGQALTLKEYLIICEREKEREEGRVKRGKERDLFYLFYAFIG